MVVQDLACILLHDPVQDQIHGPVQDKVHGPLYDPLDDQDQVNPPVQHPMELSLTAGSRLVLWPGPQLDQGLVLYSEAPPTSTAESLRSVAERRAVQCNLTMSKPAILKSHPRQQGQ